MELLEAYDKRGVAFCANWNFCDYGFSKDEVYKMVDLAGGRITRWKEWDGITIMPIKLLGKHIGILLLNSKIGARVFLKRTFYTEIWWEVIRK